MMKSEPSVGRIVLFRSLDSNGQLEHPALITRVWSAACVNLTVFPDNASPQVRTSVSYAEIDVEQQSAWRWPPRVDA